MYPQKSFKETFDFRSNIDKLYPGCKSDIVRLKTHTQSGKVRLIYKVFQDGKLVAAHRAIEMISSRTGKPYIMVVRDPASDLTDPWKPTEVERQQMDVPLDPDSIRSVLVQQ